MSDDLYQAEIIARARAGARDSRLDPHDARVTIDNPLCGDRITLDLRLADGAITEVGHRTRGCALCQAASETLRRCLPGATSGVAQQGRTQMQNYLSAGGALDSRWTGFAAFEPVRRHPSRHSCVLLPFDALIAAMSGTDDAT